MEHQLSRTRELALIVEDDRLIRRSLAGLLADEGLDVLETSTLGFARRIVASGRVGVVVLDLTLADGDAEPLIGEVSKMTRGPAIVICSADAARANRLSRSYAIPLLRKPIDLALAHATVLVALERRIRPATRHASDRRPAIKV